MSRLFFTITALCFAALAPFASAQDAEGCKDHPLLTRLPGYQISRCEEQQFASHNFLAGGKEIAVEGKFTTIRYSLKDGAQEMSRLQVHRNYENAIARIGGKVSGRNDDGALSLRLVKNGQEIWVDVSAYITSEFMLHIVEKGGMKQDVVADAAAMAAGIKSDGKIALYGILFDTGKADIKPESDAAIAEIAKLLKADAALKLNVVGHTDNVGAFDFNMKLSQARAEAVVQALVTKHGIAAVRLRAAGVGSLAPTTTNDTDDGRAKNRRVELVKQ